MTALHHLTTAIPFPSVLPATGLLKAFRGHLGELLRHPAGNHVVDELYAGEAAGAAPCFCLCLGKIALAAALPGGQPRC